MSIGGIQNQAANTSFGFYKSPDAQSRKYTPLENALIGGSVLSLGAGIAIDIFDKKGKINTKIPKALDIIGFLMLAASFLVGRKSNKSE